MKDLEDRCRELELALAERSAELEQARSQQAAVAEILRIISSAQGDVQPVFDAIVKSGARLFDGMTMSLRLIKGEYTVTAASSVPVREETGGEYPVPLSDPGGLSARAIALREVVQISDILDPEPWVSSSTKRRAQLRGYRANMAAPMLKDGRAIGTINLTRAAPGLLSGEQVALFQTFADQAVIAIENVRLFKELQTRNAELLEALEQQTATAEILGVISSSPTNIRPVLHAVAESAARLCQADDVVIRLVDGDALRVAVHIGPVPMVKSAVAIAINRDWIGGEAVLDRRTIHVEDVMSLQVRQRYPRGPSTLYTEHQFRSLLVVPMVHSNTAVGTIVLRRPEIRPFSNKQITLLETFAHQAVIAIENARLFNEIEEKSRQLEFANQHKSEFLANMSHELRTPLNAVIGFSEVLQQGMVGALNDKQVEYINYIHTSGSHLLSLINDILDLSKVEAGRMELDLTTFSVPLAIDNALTLVKERATRHGLTLDHVLHPDVTEIEADERKFKQVMLNLLSNAVKFTPEGGSITVAARRVEDMVEVSVTDTGIGIATEDCDTVFEEFRQVGTHAEGKAQGTGLGLALTRRFIELHGGRIWLTSALGKGSTFSFTLPITQPAVQVAA